MSEGKISFSFGGKPAAPAAAAPAAGPSGGMSNLERLMAQAKTTKPAPKPLTFDDEEDEPRRAAPETKAKPLMSRAERRAQEAALKIDASVFDYDGVYDSLKAAERKVEEARKAADVDKKPKHMEAFLAAARTRELDRLRAEEKMLQRERENEGDEFADKEKFVTEAYKRQMEAVRKAEEEEKAREEAQRKSRRGPGLTSMYKSMLDDDEAKHAAAVAATSNAGPSLAVKPPPKPQEDFNDEEEYDPLLAAEAGETRRPVGSTSIDATTGKQVEINDEGEVVDKRSLLKAGLNIRKKAGPVLPPGGSSLLGSSREDEDKPYVSRAVGASASYKERMERERRRLAEQIKEQEEKKRAEREQRQREEEEAARRRREGDDGQAEKKRNEARERFLARKRAREEEEGAKKRAKAE